MTHCRRKIKVNNLLGDTFVFFSDLESLISWITGTIKLDGLVLPFPIGVFVMEVSFSLFINFTLLSSCLVTNIANYSSLCRLLLVLRVFRMSIACIHILLLSGTS